ncbi:MAG: response regulator [Woeseiaceae bacterium]
MHKILIVDDEPIVIRVIRLALAKEGYEVDTAPNGKVALEKIQASAPDALITDIEMPIMTGEELCKELHSSMPEREFPIFVATSLTALEHRFWSKSIPNLSFLEKPISARKLVAELSTYFRSLNSKIPGVGHE